MNSQLTLAAQFTDQRYTILRGLVPAQEIAALHRYAMVLSRSDVMFEDEYVSNAASRYADPQMEQLLVDLLPSVEEATGLSLDPTYAFFRVYKNGDELPRHVDRPSCEVSLSLCVGYDAAETWDFWVEGPDGPFCAQLEPGDGLLYRGCECPHWREKFPGKSAAQVFLHYVDKDGPKAEYRFDKRTGLDLPAVSIRKR